MVATNHSVPALSVFNTTHYKYTFVYWGAKKQ